MDNVSRQREGRLNDRPNDRRHRMRWLKNVLPFCRVLSLSVVDVFLEGWLNL